MNNSSSLFVLLVLALVSCGNDDGDAEKNTSDNATVTLNFSHQWGDEDVTGADFNTIQYKNENGEEMSIERLRYLISKITLESLGGETIILKGYNLVDLTNGTGLSYVLPEKIPAQQYSNVSFTFGFDNEDNQNGAYPDLNTALWNVPEMLGGGYHYMQLEGRFVDSTSTETGYQYHAIRAVDNSGATLVFEDTFFKVDLGAVEIAGNSILEIKMDIAEWFKNPVKWNLNELHSMMMPNFEAQKMISQNGRSVFNLAEVRSQ